MTEYVSINDDVKKVQNGVEYPVLLLQCNIHANNNISFRCEVVDQATYEANVEIMEARISTFKQYCKVRAKEKGVFLCY